MNDLLLILISFAYIGFVILVASVISKFSKYPKELTRKFIHIMVGNWVFLYPYFHSLHGLLFVPIVFMFINTISFKYTLIEAMEREENDGYGTVYYAISLAILVYFAYTLKQSIVLYVGILIMAYGDGFAAIVGRRLGRNLPIKGFKTKSIPGSATVFLVSFLVTTISLSLSTIDVTLPQTLVIALITASVALSIELLGTNGLDNLTLPLGTSIVTYLSSINMTWEYIEIIIAQLIILGLGYKKGSITFDGIVIAMILGTSIYQLSSISLLYMLIGFFIIGSVISKVTNQTKKCAEMRQEHTGSRNWKQVCANALPSTLIVWICHLIPSLKEYQIIAYALFSTSFADTFASELGMLSNGKVISILTLQPVPTGVSGGISLFGTLSGLLGSIIASLFAYKFGFTGMVYVAVLGFVGMLIDSVLGDILQRKYVNKNGELTDIKNNHDRKYSGLDFVTNNTVNLLSLVIMCVLAFVVL